MSRVSAAHVPWRCDAKTGDEVGDTLVLSARFDVFQVVFSSGGAACVVERVVCSL